MNHKDKLIQIMCDLELSPKAMAYRLSCPLEIFSQILKGEVELKSIFYKRLEEQFNVPVLVWERMEDPRHCFCGASGEFVYAGEGYYLNNAPFNRFGYADQSDDCWNPSVVSAATPKPGAFDQLVQEMNSESLPWHL